MGPHQLGSQDPPQQAERCVGHAVGAGLPWFGVVVEHTTAHIVYNAVEIIGNHKAAGHLDVGPDDLQQRRCEHIVRMELAAMGKAFCRDLHIAASVC